MFYFVDSCCEYALQLTCFDNVWRYGEAKRIANDREKSHHPMFQQEMEETSISKAVFLIVWFNLNYLLDVSYATDHSSIQLCLELPPPFLQLYLRYCFFQICPFVLWSPSSNVILWNIYFVRTLNPAQSNRCLLIFSSFRNSFTALTVYPMVKTPDLYYIFK